MRLMGKELAPSPSRHLGRERETGQIIAAKWMAIVKKAQGQAAESLSPIINANRVGWKMSEEGVT